MKHRLQLRPLPLAVVLASTCMPAVAQVVPDAGRVLRELAPPTLPTPKPANGIEIAQPQMAPTLPGGVQVMLHTVVFSGNTRFGDAQLRAVLGNVANQSYDLAGLRALAARISEFYQRSGYPFARAYLPAQPLTDGRLRIEVLEGRYGQVRASGQDKLAAAAQPFLATLKPGAPIATGLLERATLILDDQPGITTAPIVRPGQEPGTGDLEVQVSRTRRFSGEAGLDNHGNRYNGQYRARVNGRWDSPFLFGDQIQLRSLLTDERMWLGSLSYSLPLGASGLRGQVGYSHTAYQLGKQFAVLDATGTARVSSLGLTYPLLRSRQANVSLGVSFQHKQLQDKQGLANTEDNKQSDVVPLTLSFDLRDDLAGGGITYGTIGWTPGRLRLDGALRAIDQATVGSEGSFRRANLDLARLQNLGKGWTGYGRISAQRAGKSLDSSEGFGLGGADGVRAFPAGEGYGDEGLLAQLELRYGAGDFAPFVFHDAGSVRNKEQAATAGSSRRSFAGSGVGVRFQSARWNAEMSMAWRTVGGDTASQRPRVWLTAEYKF